MDSTASIRVHPLPSSDFSSQCPCVSSCHWCTGPWEDRGTGPSRHFGCVAMERNGAAAGGRQTAALCLEPSEYTTLSTAGKLPAPLPSQSKRQGKSLLSSSQAAGLRKGRGKASRDSAFLFPRSTLPQLSLQLSLGSTNSSLIPRMTLA